MVYRRPKAILYCTLPREKREMEFNSCKKKALKYAHSKKR